MATRRPGWQRGHTGWAFGTALVFAIGIIVGLALSNVWLGVLLALIVSIGWLIAYESWRGRNVGIEDRDDNGAQL
ncbi:hypothetical protein GCM10009775_06400 [Microbacterium aoyamense]|uniref:Cytochrome-c oxidase n=1 Tax=Microbacterium aoyamense TaxID=344166 RepID=A0ABP5AKX1_9MICO|nr:hypothetical protein [Microbacterium aoyamense]